jgi:hypothetical protein
MSIPQRARELRKAFDDAQLFTLHIPGSKGAIHQLRVSNPVNTQTDMVWVMVLVESSRYTLADGANETRLTEIDEMVEAVRKALQSD